MQSQQTHTHIVIIMAYIEVKGMCSRYNKVATLRMKAYPSHPRSAVGDSTNQQFNLEKLGKVKALRFTLGPHVPLNLTNPK